MLELKSWYRDRLPTRIAALESARAGIPRSPAESVESIRRIAHSLRGSGATYGFPEITEAARHLEEAGEREIPPCLETLLSTLRDASVNGRNARAGILLIEDDEEQAHFMKAVLEGPQREIHVAHTAAQAQAILEEREVALIVLDLILPDTDGRNLLLRLRERLATAAIPVVVVTVKSAAQARDECIALGADDFVEKPVTKAILDSTVGARLRAGSEFSRELRRDPLTGLPNRAAFHEVFLRARCSAAASGEPLTVGILDFDRFKEVNDAFGHAMGDQVLRRASAAISRTLRTSDFLARWGGEEFVAIFPKTDGAGAAIALGKALRALREEPFPVGEGRTASVSFSAGVAAVGEAMTLEEAVSEADRFLHLAKTGGMSRVLSAADRVAAPPRRVLLAEDDELIRIVVRRLVEREGCEVVPVEDGAEALARAQQGRYSMVISDVRMPGMDGFELLARLRSLPAYARTPVMMLTSMGSEEDVLRGFELGADDYVVKPFSSAELATRVRRLLKKAAVTPR